MDELKSQIDAAFAEQEDVEHKARTIENRINTLTKDPSLLPKRAYGKPVNGEEFGMTLKTVINRDQPELAAYLGIANGFHRINEEREEAQKLINEGLALKTQQLREKNEARKRQLEWEARTGIDSLTGRQRV